MIGLAVFFLPLLISIVAAYFCGRFAHRAGSHGRSFIFVFAVVLGGVVLIAVVLSAGGPPYSGGTVTDFAARQEFFLLQLSLVGGIPFLTAIFAFRFGRINFESDQSCQHSSEEREI
ncbi:hypothetical protein [Candidatus Rhodobacter oscarellae]|uniref:hypothetical protein n=1 Tax=Candidatus Rhodobacter oscarellae TaxID=1675527 RepID=UPI00128ECD12|nr:hypothetical protein [Candidatus Rhodobacter lobularis]